MRSDSWKNAVSAKFYLLERVYKGNEKKRSSVFWKKCKLQKFQNWRRSDAKKP